MKTNNLTRAFVAALSLVLTAPVFAQAEKHKRDACAVPMTLRLKGLHCEGCEANVKGELQAVKGVEEVSVSAKKQQAVVWVCSHKNVKPDALKAAVKKAGYTVLKVEKGEPKPTSK